MTAAPILRFPDRQCRAARALERSRHVGAALVGGTLLLLGGCATTTEFGRVERLPEGTLPPSKEVGPPVNIQPAPPPPIVVHGPVYPGYWNGYPSAPGWYGRQCFDPFFCGPGWGGPSYYYHHGGGRRGSGFGLHYRLF